MFSHGQVEIWEQEEKEKEKAKAKEEKEEGEEKEKEDKEEKEKEEEDKEEEKEKEVWLISISFFLHFIAPQFFNVYLCTKDGGTTGGGKKDAKSKKVI